MLRYVLILYLFLFSSIVYAKNYAHIDNTADQAPSEVSQDTLGDLVQTLTAKYYKEEDKARVILAWIVKNIDYDHYRYDKILEKDDHKFRDKDLSVPPSDILEVHLGICQDLAVLYVQMAQKAGLTARVVHGYAGYNLKKSTYKKYPHAWVIVTIDGEEKFIDPTWAIQGGTKDATQKIKNNTAYQKELERRQKKKFQPQKDRSIKDAWFLTEPKVMIKTHFPQQESDQLLTHPVSLSIFLIRSRL